MVHDGAIAEVAYACGPGGLFVRGQDGGPSQTEVCQCQVATSCTEETDGGGETVYNCQ